MPSHGSHASTIKKRTRASKPKVRTGCLTCKIRRVKCGEEKPACHRCKSTGRKCDGYDQTKPIRTRTEEALRNLELARHDFIREYQQNASLQSMRPLQADIQGSETERRFFHDFRTSVGHGLAIHVSHFTAFWQRFVPQLSHQDDAVKHAVVALGSAYKRFLGDDAFTTFDLDVFTLQQYNKSMSSLARTASTSPSGPAGTIRSTLVCCLAFICIETLRSNHLGALTHLQNGLRIIDSLPPHTLDFLWGCDDCVWDTRAHHDATPPPPPQRKAPAPDTDADMRDIVWMFTRLEMSASFFSGAVSPHLVHRTVDRRRWDAHGRQREFGSVGDMHAELCIHSRYVMVEVLASKAHFGDVEYWGEAGNARHHRAMLQRSQRLEGACKKFRRGPYGPKVGSCANFSMQSDLLHTYLVQLFLEVMTGVEEDEQGKLVVATELRYSETHMREMVDIAAGMVQFTKGPKDKYRAMFTTDMGIVGPIYVVATTTQDAGTRQGALKILQNTKLREGFWNGPAIQTLVKKMMRATKDKRWPSARMPRGLWALGAVPSMYETLAEMESAGLSFEE